MKVCRTCHTPKTDNDFWMDPSYLDGRRTECGACCRARAKKRRIDNHGKEKRYALAWRVANPDKAKSYQTTHRNKHREKINSLRRARSKINNDKERRRMLAWQKANRAKCNAANTRRYAAKLRAAPKWANLFFIEEIYDLAQLRTKATGFAWHVDHIVPLQSKKVCGLHVENNLRVIPAFTNRAKGNRSWPDMPEMRQAA